MGPENARTYINLPVNDKNNVQGHIHSNAPELQVRHLSWAFNWGDRDIWYKLPQHYSLHSFRFLHNFVLDNALVGAGLRLRCLIAHCGLPNNEAVSGVLKFI